MTCHVSTNVKAQENLMIYFWGKIPFVLDFLARDIANHSYAPNTPLTDVLNPLNTEILPTLLSLDHLYSPDYFAGLCWTRLQNSRFFFLKISKEIGKAWREARESLSPPVSLSVFSLVPDLLFDCSRVLEYTKIRTVLQSTVELERTDSRQIKVVQRHQRGCWTSR